jgi:hypothetical protein
MWKPSDEPPSEGEIVLGYYPDEWGGEVATCCFVGGGFHHQACCARVECSYHGVQPTLWAPCPAPPTTQRGSS